MAQSETFSDVLKEILSLQPSWSGANIPPMERRGVLVRAEGPAILRRWISKTTSGVDDLSVEGKDGVGLKSRVPWIRVHSRRLSPSAKVGWYLVYLFATDGSAAFLSLNQGTTDSNFGPKAKEFLDERVLWARETLVGASLPSAVQEEIDLEDPAGGLGSGYERGSVMAIRYDANTVPDDSVLSSDLDEMLFLLSVIYDAEGDLAALPKGYGSGEALSTFTKPAPYIEATIRLAANVPGVHVVWDPNGDLLYVGSTGSQRTRLRQHLSGDRQASVLHDKVGRQLDFDLGTEANKDQIRAYLERCTVAWKDTEDRDSLKRRIMDELRPRLNDVRPKVQTDPRVLVAYLGRRFDANLRVGTEQRLWGFPDRRDEYSSARTGDWILIASGFTGGSPRVSSEEWRMHHLDELLVGRITNPYHVDDTPIWPAEKVGDASYPHRFGFEKVQKLSNVALNSDTLSDDVVEAIRLSALNRGLGYVVAAQGGAFQKEITVEEAPSLSRICEQFATALADANLEFGTNHLAMVRTFVVSLATKRLVLITGLSGSGKTRLAMGFGQWLGRDRFLLVPVRPDWTGPESLLGYEDALLPPANDGQRAWTVPNPLAFILKAASDPSHPYLLLLDEMNLAHIERYFADVLSGMESDAPVIPNLELKGGFWRPGIGEPRLPFPRNLFIVGTVNVDETTYMFSPKVLDRSNTIEFKVDAHDLRTDALKPNSVDPGEEDLVTGFLRIATDDSFQARSPADNRDEIAETLKSLHELLAPYGLEFGHRTFYEALRFAALLQAAGEGSQWRALDLQIMQKILPRLHGSMRKLREPLSVLAHFCYDPVEAGKSPNTSFDAEVDVVGDIALPESFSKVTRMARSLRINQFVSFSE